MIILKSFKKNFFSFLLLLLLHRLHNSRVLWWNRFRSFVHSNKKEKEKKIIYEMRNNNQIEAITEIEKQQQQKFVQSQ